jgi:hypothetical protein
LRRLLAFGTGAAVIGLFLLLVAFFESYIIVGQLQNELANQTSANVNVILEDATLEAVFLGVMVALGYGLISQGLGGIRRQEMLELEKSEEDEMVKARVMAKITRERAAEKERAAGIRHVVTSQGMETKPRAEATAPETPVPPEASVPVPIPPVWSPQVPAEAPEPIVAGTPQSLSQVTWEPSSTVPETPKSSPAQPVPAEQPPDQKSAPLEPAPASQSAPLPTPGPAAAPAPEAPEVVWEGGAPAKLEGVEVLPEPPEHGVYSAASRPSVAPEPEQPAEAPAPPKRGRGRPKGSKKKAPSDNTSS